MHVHLHALSIVSSGLLGFTWAFLLMSFVFNACLCFPKLRKHLFQLGLKKVGWISAGHKSTWKYRRCACQVQEESSIFISGELSAFNQSYTLLLLYT